MATSLSLPRDVRCAAFYASRAELVLFGGSPLLDSAEFYTKLQSNKDALAAFMLEAQALKQDLLGFFSKNKPVKRRRLSSYILSCRLHNNHRDIFKVCPLKECNILGKRPACVPCKKLKHKCYLAFSPPIFTADAMVSLYITSSVEPGAEFFFMDDNMSRQHQLDLWLQGISVHNPVTNECCPDFSCCLPSDELAILSLFPGTPMEERQAFYDAYINGDHKLLEELCAGFLGGVSSSFRDTARSNFFVR